MLPFFDVHGFIPGHSCFVKLRRGGHIDHSFALLFIQRQEECFLAQTLLP